MHSTGGSLGREGSHDVIIPDINCSKYHLKFEYDGDRSGYTCIDLGSRNGTLMNGKRMSNAKQESEPMNLLHGTVLQIGQTKLLCHIHEGHSTCGQCEPGLLGAGAISGTSKTASANDDHKRQLKNLKKRYGLQDESKHSNMKHKSMESALINLTRSVYFQNMWLPKRMQKMIGPNNDEKRLAAHANMKKPKLHRSARTCTIASSS